MQNWLVVGRIAIFILSPSGRFGYPIDRFRAVPNFGPAFSFPTPTDCGVSGAEAAPRLPRHGGRSVGSLATSHEARRQQSTLPAESRVARLVAGKSMCFVAPPVRHSSPSTA
jgi:hypothetical protein